MNHPTDRQLELWLSSKEELDHDETTSISDHLESCQFCKERLEKLQAYYSDLEREINQGPGEKERSMASKVYQRRTNKTLPSGSLIQTFEAPLKEHHSSLPVQVKNYLRQHPVGSASMTIGTIFLAALLFVIQPWSGINNNPIYAEVERNVLHVYNQEGESIWNMVVEGIPNETNSEIDAERPSKRFMRIADIDGDDTNEVLLTGNNYEGNFTANTIYCFNNDGSLRWKQDPPPAILFGERTHSSVMNWDILDFFLLNPAEDKPRLFVTSNSSWFPSVLFELNVSNGEILQTYWHPGWIWDSEVYQSGNGENDRIILGTTNNTYQSAALAVLNPDRINGHAPVKKSYQPKSVTRADEEHYIMFKPSRLNRLFSHQLYNEISRLRVTNDGRLLVRGLEKLYDPDKQVSILYTLNDNFTVLEARGVASYEKLYSDLYNEGRIDQPLTESYWDALRDSVLYWDENRSSFISHGQLEK